MITTKAVAIEVFSDSRCQRVIVYFNRRDWLGRSSLRRAYFDLKASGAELRWVGNDKEVEREMLIAAERKLEKDWIAEQTAILLRRVKERQIDIDAALAASTKGDAT